MKSIAEHSAIYKPLHRFEWVCAAQKGINYMALGRLGILNSSTVYTNRSNFWVAETMLGLK